MTTSSSLLRKKNFQFSFLSSSQPLSFKQLNYASGKRYRIRSRTIPAFIE